MVSTFKYLWVHTWSLHTNTLLTKAQRCPYHSKQLRRVRVTPVVLKSFYTAAFESVWFGNCDQSDQRSRTLHQICSALPAEHLYHLYRTLSTPESICSACWTRSCSPLARTERLDRCFAHTIMPQEWFRAVCVYLLMWRIINFLNCVCDRAIRKLLKKDLYTESLNKSQHQHLHGRKQGHAGMKRSR